MPLPSSMDATWVNPSSVQYNALELRRSDAALMGGSGDGFGVRSGVVRHGDTTLNVSVSTGDVVTIGAGSVVISEPLGSYPGGYRAALGQVETGSLAARNATLPRWDLVVFRILDADLYPAHGAYTGRVEVITGTPASTPVVPTRPNLAVELARIYVPAQSGGAASVDMSRRPYAVAPGGLLPVTTASQLTGLGGALQDRAIALDTGVEYVYTSTGWTEAGLWSAYTPTLAFFSGGTVGNATLTGRFKRRGRRIDFRARFVAGSTTAMGTVPRIGLPVPASPDVAFTTVSALLFGPTTFFHGVGFASPGNAYAEVYSPGTNGQYVNITGSAPFTWSTGSQLDVSGSYEASS